MRLRVRSGSSSKLQKKERRDMNMSGDTAVFESLQHFFSGRSIDLEVGAAQRSISLRRTND